MDIDYLDIEELAEELDDDTEREQLLEYARLLQIKDQWKDRKESVVINTLALAFVVGWLTVTICIFLSVPYAGWIAALVSVLIFIFGMKPLSMFFKAMVDKSRERAYKFHQTMLPEAQEFLEKLKCRELV
jgi:hypothetical protein